MTTTTWLDYCLERDMRWIVESIVVGSWLDDDNVRRIVECRDLVMEHDDGKGPLVRMKGSLRRDPRPSSSLWALVFPFPFPFPYPRSNRGHYSLYCRDWVSLAVVGDGIDDEYMALPLGRCASDDEVFSGSARHTSDETNTHVETERMILPPPPPRPLFGCSIPEEAAC